MRAAGGKLTFSTYNVPPVALEFSSMRKKGNMLASVLL